jgi:biotin carboxylase
MTNKGILIIGGGLLQHYAIDVARKKGLIIHLTDGSDNCYCNGLVDYFYKINTKDYIATSKLAVKLKNQNDIHSIYTQGTDVAFTVAYCAQKTNLPGIDPEVAWSTENKIEMRKKLYNSGIDKTKFIVVKDSNQLLERINEIKLPCYVKPADNSGSRGITRVVKHSELKIAYENAISNCLIKNEVLIEEEILGNEYSIDTIVIDGVLYNAGISDRVFNKKNIHAVQSGSITPSLLPEKLQLEMLTIMKKIAKAFDINNCALKGDLVIDENNNVKVIEIAARTSGGFDSQVRKPVSFGIDIISATIDLSFGNEVKFNDIIPKWIKWSKTTSLFPTPGVVENILGEEWIKHHNSIVDYKILVKKKDKIMEYDDCSKRTNYFTFKSDTYNNLISLENDIFKKFKIIT